MSYKQDEFLFPHPIEEVIKTAQRSGWLEKQGHALVKKWQLRFFILHGTHLYYFNNDPSNAKNAKLLGILDVKHCGIVFPSASPSDPPTIQLTPKNVKGRTYHLTSTDHPNDVREWEEDIKIALRPPPARPAPPLPAPNSDTTAPIPVPPTSESEAASVSAVEAPSTTENQPQNVAATAVVEEPSRAQSEAPKEETKPAVVVESTTTPAEVQKNDAPTESTNGQNTSVQTGTSQTQSSPSAKKATPFASRQQQARPIQMNAAPRRAINTVSSTQAQAPKQPELPSEEDKEAAAEFSDDDDEVIDQARLEEDVVNDVDSDEEEDFSDRVNLPSVCEKDIERLTAENHELQEQAQKIFAERKAVVLKDEGKISTSRRSDIELEAIPRRWAVCYCYAQGNDAAPQVIEASKKAGLSFCDIAFDENTNIANITTTLASSGMIVLILSQDCLKIKALAQAIEAGIGYRKARIIHPTTQCNLPDVKSVSSVIRGLLYEKPIAFLPEYVDAVISKIISETKAALNMTPSRPNFDAFLSFDRFTGQGIATRLYEGLRSKYQVCLFTEYDLKPGQVDEMISRSETLIVCLTEGYLKQSECLSQLRIAIRANKQILVIKDFLFKELPADTPADLKYILDSSTTIKWMAEFNQLCVGKLEAFFDYISKFTVEKIGLDSMIAFSQGPVVVSKRCTRQFPLLITSDWTGRVAPTLVALKNYLDCEVEALKFTLNVDNYIERVLPLGGDLVPVKIIELDTAVSDQGFRDFLAICPVLERLSISQSHIKDDSMLYLTKTCPRLKELKIDSDVLTDAGVKQLVYNSSSLKRLALRGRFITEVSLKYIAGGKAPMCSIRTTLAKITDQGIAYLAAKPRRSLKRFAFVSAEDITDKGLKMLADAFPLLEGVDLEGSFPRDEGVKYIVDHCKNLKKLRVAKNTSDEVISYLTAKNPTVRVSREISRASKFTPGKISYHTFQKWVNLKIQKKQLQKLVQTTKCLGDISPYQPPKVVEEVKPAASQEKPQTIQEKTAIQAEISGFYMGNVSKLNVTAPDYSAKATNMAGWYRREMGKLFAVPIYVRIPFEPTLDYSNEAQVAEFEKRYLDSLNPQPEAPAPQDNTNSANATAETSQKSEPAPREEEAEEEDASTIHCPVKGLYSSSSAQRSPSWRMSLVFMQDTGTRAATFIRKRVDHVWGNAAANDCRSLEIPRKNQRGIDWDSLEESVAKSGALVVVLSEKCLQCRAFVFVLEAASHYKVPVILVHDADTCFFPADQPESVRVFFSEKAVTFLSDYTDDVVQQIIQRVEEHEQILMAEKASASSANEETSHENLHTRLFLSHKRSTAQHIAGRLWESFHQDYKVFLDSEAQFKIHDLDHIVSQTDLFVLILSQDYFKSYFCMAELASAIRNKKKLVIVQNADYIIPPELLSDTAFKMADLPVMNLSQVLTTSPKFMWNLEYHRECVQSIKKTVLGGSDEMLERIEQMQRSDESVQQALKKKRFDAETPLDLSRWEFFHTLESFLLGLVVNYGCTITHVVLEGVTIRARYFVMLADYCPQLESISLERSKIQENNTSRDDQDVIAEFVAKCPSLRECNFYDCPSGHKILDCGEKAPNLHSLKISNVDDTKMSQLLQTCPSLRRLGMKGNGSNATDNLLKLLAKTHPGLEKLTVYSQGVTDRGLEQLTEKCQSLAHLSLLNSSVGEHGLRHLALNRIALQSFKYNSTFSDVGLATIAGLSSGLKKLVVTSAKVSKAGLDDLVAKCPLLEELDISSANVKDDILAALIPLSSLRVLKLLGAKYVSDAGLQTLSHANFSLREFALSQTDACTEKGIQYLTSKHGATLQSMTLPGASLSDQALHHLAGCKEVKTLKAWWPTARSNITNKGAIELAKSCKHLQTLTVLAENTKVTDVSLKALAKYCPYLDELDVKKTGVTVEGVQYLTKRNPGVKIFWKPE